MAISANDITARALALLGGAPEDTGVLSGLCAAAASEMESRLREGVSPDDIGELFITAAGMLALSMYIEVGAADDAAGVKAGNVTVSRRGAREGIASAASLRREAEAMLSAFLKDRGFGFVGVRG
ncbi:MAG TPA: hypothetical protein DC001_00840 [Clostridiales bacterium]|jgi:hypothetical protein|nr:hypothetical protein [Clostridiales bacterium]HBR09240.1 hypothetical protein [Clostridiales bacterium]